ncbi:MAG: DUF4097 family beta strand repeat-containing protein [Halanaerobiales bacterium]|nr:DUF4097 family beta strand repeat-containing protein [Halanaerobiales bacterium]
MKKKIIIALILIVLFIVMIGDFQVNNEDVLADFFRHFETRSMHNISNFNFNNENPKVSYESGFNYQTQDIDNMLIDNDIGSVKVMGYNKEEIVIQYQINVYSDSKDLAEKYIDDLKVEYDVIGDLLVIRTVRMSPKPLKIDGYEIDFNIKAPQSMFVELKNSYGDTELNNFSNGVDVKTKYSFTKLSNLKGKIKVENDYGNLKLENIDGDIYLNTSYNNNSISDLEGSLQIKTTYAQNHLNNINADTMLTGRYGGGRINSINGNLDLDIKYMGLSIDRVTGKIDGKMEYGEVNIANLDNSLDIDTRYCDLLIWMEKDFKDLNVNVNTKNGDIKSDLNLPIIKEGNYESVSGILNKGQYNLMIDGSYADIKLLYEN